MKAPVYRTYLLILALILLNSSGILAQKVSWDSTARPDIYAPRVALMKTFQHSKKDIVFLGNSITFWAEWSELLENRACEKPGDSGRYQLRGAGKARRGNQRKTSQGVFNDWHQRPGPECSRRCITEKLPADCQKNKNRIPCHQNLCTNPVAHQ